MFDIGFWELCLIGIVGLLVIGPDRLPGVARTLGHWVGKAQRMVNGVKSDIHREFEASELRELLGEQKKQIDELQGLVGETQRGVESSAREAIEAGGQSWVEQVAGLHDEETRRAQAENSIMPSPPIVAADPPASGGGGKNPADPGEVADTDTSSAAADSKSA